LLTTDDSLQVRASEPSAARRILEDTLKFITKRKTTLSAVLILVALLFIAAFGPLISPYGANTLNLSDRLQRPNSAHLLGTDNFGRDVLSRALSGTRVTLLLGLSISGFALLLGLPIGMLCGFYDRFGMVVMRVVDAMMAFPAIILALSLMAIFGKPGILNVIIAVRALGMPSFRILVRHIAINLLSPVIVQATFTFAFSIMEVAALNFLGVGIPPYIASWGGMMNEGRTYIIRASWIILFPGVFLATAVLSFNLLGDALRDRLDPKLRRIM